MTGEWDPSPCIRTCNPDAALTSLVPPCSWFSSLLAGTKRQAATPESCVVEKPAPPEALFREELT